MNDDIEPQAEASPKNQLAEEPVISSLVTADRDETSGLSAERKSPRKMDPYELEYIIEQNQKELKAENEKLRFKQKKKKDLKDQGQEFEMDDMGLIDRGRTEELFLIRLKNSGENLPKQESQIVGKDQAFKNLSQKRKSQTSHVSKR